MTAWTYDHSLVIPAPAARLFAAFTTRDDLEWWFAEHARVEPRVGGAYRFWGRHTVGTPGDRDATGTVSALEPDERLDFDWTVCGVPSRVTITFTPQEAARGAPTKVTVRHELSDALPQPRPKELIDDWWRFSLGNLMTFVIGHGEVLRPAFGAAEPEIRLSVFVDAPRESVFRALTEPNALREWMGAPAPVVEPRPGGRFELGWKYEVDGRQMTGGPTQVLDVVPNERLVVSWPDWRGDARCRRSPSRGSWRPREPARGSPSCTRDAPAPWISATTRSVGTLHGRDGQGGPALQAVVVQEPTLRPPPLSGRRGRLSI